MIIEFFLINNTHYISNEECEYIVEGFINIDCGILAAGTTEEPEVEILMKQGVYRFRSYLDTVKGETQACRIYFWPTDEPETNDITVIKRDMSMYPLYSTDIGE